jgi:hypothetical protein
LENRIVFFLLFLEFNSTQAQTGFDDDVQDVPASPIDDYLWILLVLGTAYVFWKLRAAQQKKA